MPQWIGAEEDLYGALMKAYKTIAPDIEDVLPDQVRGVLRWRKAASQRRREPP